MVVFTADHGEEFGDHGGVDHGHTLFEELVRVPLVIRAPGFAPRRVPGTVQVVDVLPTVHELLGLEAPAVREGESLVPAMGGAPLGERAALAELRRSDRNDLASLATGRWKLILDRSRGRRLLYDRQVDRGERVDVAAEHPEVVRELLAELEARRTRALELGQRFERGSRRQPGADELANLEDLGYAGDE